MFGIDVAIVKIFILYSEEQYIIIYKENNNKNTGFL
jgi:hypothetical protein